MIDQADIDDIRLYLNQLSSKILLLEDDSHKNLSGIIDRDDRIQTNKSFFFRNARAAREDLLHIQKDLDLCNVKLIKLGSLFRGTVKNDRFSRFNEVIDIIPFEFFLTEKEAKDIMDK